VEIKKKLIFIGKTFSRSDALRRNEYADAPAPPYFLGEPQSGLLFVPTRERRNEENLLRAILRLRTFSLLQGLFHLKPAVFFVFLEFGCEFYLAVGRASSCAFQHRVVKRGEKLRSGKS
jgi:hypothetical protein